MSETPIANAYCLSRMREYSGYGACVKCGIRNECHAHVIPLTKQTFDKYCERLEVAAIMATVK